MNMGEYEHGAACVAARSRAHALFSLYGVATPEPQFGEDLGRYRRRLLSMAQGLLPSSSPWRGVPVHQQPDLDAVEAHLFDDQAAAFRAPIGPLRSVTEVDASNRPVRRFFGDPENTWGPFKGVRRLVTAWSSAGRGKDGPGPRANPVVAQVLRDGTTVPVR
jgi:hypothetical protein